MNLSDDNHRVPSKRPFAPHGHLLFYSAAACFTYFTFLPYKEFRVPSLITAVCFYVVGVMLWMRSRWSTLANCVLGVVLILYGVYAFAVSGWSSVPLGFWIGGCFTLGGHWAIKDEIVSQRRN